MGGVLEKDPAPHLTARQEQAVQVLSTNKAPFRRYPQCFLVLVGLRPYYLFDENTYPAFKRPNKIEMGLLDYIRIADPRKVQAVEVQKGEEQVKLLDSIKHCFVSLHPPAVAQQEMLMCLLSRLEGEIFILLTPERKLLAGTKQMAKFTSKHLRFVKLSMSKVLKSPRVQPMHLLDQVSVLRWPEPWNLCIATRRFWRLEAHVIDVSGRLEGEFYPAYLTALAGQRWMLTHGVKLAMVKCLKSLEYQGILGHALGRAVDFGMQEGLAAGHEHGVAETPLSVVTAYNPETAEANYLDAVRALEEANFPLVHLLKSKKDSGMDELSVPIYHVDVKAVIRETSLSFALLNVHTRAEGAKKHAATLRQLMVDIISHPLSSQNLVGEASTSAATLSVEDLDTDEDLGSVVCMPQFEDPRFEILP
ncbi:hypothetical protein Tco_0977223 [Tanacetum coccineum]|uniref:Uncharacterized protein n=1 Tax=Tanacetum coccineum TaxID=301880 RepID=A0ABQ5EJG7_9ASTR